MPDNNWPNGLQMNHPNLPPRLAGGYELEAQYLLEDFLEKGNKALIDYHRSKGARSVVVYNRKPRGYDTGVTRGQFRDEKGFTLYEEDYTYSPA
tara:strand:+ start:466 stop:747 length:282 start_codon:yes stop_codon:yes gene_type:complete